MAFGCNLPRPCRCSSDWGGADIGLRRYSLRFSSAQREDGFLKSRSRKLLSNGFYLASAGLFGCVMSFLVHVADLPNIEQRLGEAVATVIQVKVGLLFTCGCFHLLLIVFARCSAMYSRISNSSLELIILLWLCITMFFSMTFLGGNWTLTKIAGHNPLTTWDKTCFCETSTILTAAGVVTVSHVVLPLRWPLLVFISIASVGWYTAMSIIWGDIGREGFFSNYTIYILLVVVITGGKRSNEITERKLFAELAKEKTLRCEAEFHLQQEEHRREDADKQEHDRTSEANSLPTSASSKAIFDAFFSGTAQSNFSALFKLGLQEHWLISTDDLLLLPSQVLGAGSFGLVVAGSFHSAKVAVKLPHSTVQASALPNSGSLANELRVLRACRHPYLVQFYGAILDPIDRRLALVLEYVEGSTLDKFIGETDTEVTTSARYDLILSTCCALCYLHSRVPQIVHGDLKGSNVLVEHRSSGVHAKLADFGLSRILTRKARQLGGTLAWMAPELYYQHQPKVSSDVFSFGRLLFFIATGTKPLQGQSKRSIEKMLRSGLVPPLDWPGTGPLEAYCKPKVEECSQIPEDLRPSMNQLQKELVAWPIDSATVIHEGATEWSKSLKLLRRFISKGNKPRAAVVGKSKQTNSQQEALTSTNRQLSSIPESRAVTSLTSSRSIKVVLPRFKATPDETQGQMIANAIQHCNFEINTPTCCLWHAAMRSLVKSCKQLSESECDNTFFDVVQWQCLECGALLTADDEGYCDVCGAIEGQDITSRSEELENDPHSPKVTSL